jgi:intracellular multiplication protein IcmE
MAGKKENIKALFTNTRSRVIILFTVILLITAVVIGIIKLKSSSDLGPDASANVSMVPGGIRSIPGALEPTAQYAKLQEVQNIDQAKTALEKGGSSIPTIIRTQALGAGVQPIGAQAGEGGVGFTTLSMEDQGGAQRSLWLQELQKSSCSKVSVTKVVSEGAVLADLKAACTCIQLKDDGYQISDLVRVCSCKELRAAGFNARQLKDADLSARRLRLCGFDACELRSAGFTAQQMKDGDFSDGELKGAGFSASDIAKASGLPDGIIGADVRNAGCQVDALTRLRAAGVTAAAIRRITGCSAAQLKAAGFSAADLRNAGFSAADLKNAGFTAEQLKQAGFGARDLLNAGFTPDDLAKAGFTSGEVAAAESKLPPGISFADIKSAGCDVEALKKERLASVSAKLISQYTGCSAQALKEAGFTDNDLANAGPTPLQLLSAGFTPQQLSQAGIKTAAIIAAGRTADCSVASLKAAQAAGVSATTIKQTLGCSTAAMKAAGYAVATLKDAGFKAAELKNAGFAAAELKNAGFSAKELRDAGFGAASLKGAGFTARQLKDAGSSLADLKNAGFTASQLKAAGSSAKNLKDAGFSAAALRQAGYSAKDLKGNYTAAELKNAGFSNADLQNAGISPDTTLAGLQAAAQPSSVPSNLAGIPTVPGGQAPSSAAAAQAASAQQLQEILKRQNQQLADQKYQQKIQQRVSQMLGTANQSMQEWKKVSTQTYTSGSEEKKGTTSIASGTQSGLSGGQAIGSNGVEGNSSPRKAIIKTGDILFAVLDTSVNSDEPGPILATIVSDKLKGAKLIGSFTLPANADKMVISFNTISVPGSAATTSISAYAIDPNTARTALSSDTDHHYLLRYGSLFASSFLEGFGNAFQSANTTVTIGGTGGGNNVTVQNGVGRSALQNAVIGLATVGKSWGQVAQQQFSRPITVEVYSGTGLGILFTQDLTSL